MRSAAPAPSSRTTRMTTPSNHAFVMVPRRSVSAVTSSTEVVGAPGTPGNRARRRFETPIEYSSEDDKDADYSVVEFATREGGSSRLRSFTVWLHAFDLYYTNDEL